MARNARRTRPLAVECLEARTVPAQFYALGVPAGSGGGSTANAVSADGNVVVGERYTSTQNEAFRWTSDGLVPIGDLAGGGTHSIARAVSADGNVIVGSGESATGIQAFRWTAGPTPQGTMTALAGAAGTVAMALSADGVVAGGFDGSGSAVRWTAGGFEALGSASSHTTSGTVFGASGDGLFVVGNTYVDNAVTGPLVRAARWPAGSSQPQVLGVLPGGPLYNASYAYAASADGNVVVGTSSSANGNEAFRWTLTGSPAMQPLGDLDGGIVFSSATAVSADGQVVVGSGTTAAGQEAFIWYAAENRMVRLRDVLNAKPELSAALAGWTLREAKGISADGMVIAGSGLHNGKTEGWVVDLRPRNYVAKRLTWNTTRGPNASNQERGIDFEFAMVGTTTFPAIDFYWVNSDGATVAASTVPTHEPMSLDSITVLTNAVPLPDGSYRINMPARWGAPPTDATDPAKTAVGIIAVLRNTSGANELDSIDNTAPPIVFHPLATILSNSVTPVANGTSIDATFSPGGAGSGITLSEAEVVAGVDHFNWLQYVTAVPETWTIVTLDNLPYERGSIEQPDGTTTETYFVPGSLDVTATGTEDQKTYQFIYTNNTDQTEIHATVDRVQYLDPITLLHPSNSKLEAVSLRTRAAVVDSPLLPPYVNTWTNGPGRSGYLDALPYYYSESTFIDGTRIYDELRDISDPDGDALLYHDGPAQSPFAFYGANHPYISFDTRLVGVHYTASEFTSWAGNNYRIAFSWNSNTIIIPFPLTDGVKRGSVSDLSAWGAISHGGPDPSLIAGGGVFGAVFDDGTPVPGFPTDAPPLPTIPDPTPRDPVRPVTVGGAADGSVQLFAAGAATSITPFGNLGTTTRTTTADVNCDGVADIVAVTGSGTAIRLTVLSGKDGSALVAPFDPFGQDFLGGGYVAAGDLDGDGRAEFVVSPGDGGGPRVTVFSLNPDGSTAVRHNFLGIDDTNFRGGARAAVGDVNGDGTPDLVVAAGFGGGPRVAVFEGKSVLAGAPVRLVSDFFAFPGSDATNLRNGAFVAAGDVDGDGFAELVFGGGPGGAPRVFILSGALVSTGQVDAAQAAPVANFFVGGNPDDRGGARVAVTNRDGDGRADVAVGSGAGRPAKVRVYLGKDFGGGGEPPALELEPFGGAVLADGVYVG